MTEKQSPVVLALEGASPERIAVEGAIYSALGRWTGVEVTPDQGLPRLRSGTVHFERPSLLSGSIAEKIMRAAGIEGRADLSASLDRLRACEAAIRAAVDTYSKLELSEKIGSWRPRWGETVERRVIDSMGLWVAFPTASEAALEALAAKIVDAEEKLARFPSGAGRPRNEAAHQVALELALLYANVTARKPTYSESRDGLHGDFTPALRAVFDALGWNRIALRGPAEAAVAAITDEHIAEVTRPRTMLFGGILPTVPRA